MTKTDYILTQTSNRQYALPDRKWKYFQEWHDTLFLNWKVPKVLLEKHIPKELELDTFNNMAWVSLVAFEVKKMRPRNLPAIPYVSNFHEINVRTYVIKNGIPGIYMFSIETNKFIEVLLTRFFIGLPYQKSNIKRTKTALSSNNETSNYHLNVHCTIEPYHVKKTAVNLWLTERHALYEKCRGKICRFDIHHKEWELQKVHPKIHSIKHNAGDYALSAHPDSFYYSKKIDVVFWAKKEV